MSRAHTPSLDHPWRHDHAVGDLELDEILANDHLGNALPASVYFAERHYAVKKEPRIPFRYSIKNCPRWARDLWTDARRKDPSLTPDDFRMYMLVAMVQANLEPVYQRNSERRRGRLMASLSEHNSESFSAPAKKKLVRRTKTLGEEV